MSLRVGVLGATGSWHSAGLGAALAARGHAAVLVPATRLELSVGGAGAVEVRGPGGEALHELDLLFVRGLPRGSLEQVIFRMDALHLLADDCGVRCVNPPRALERTLDKAWAAGRLAAAGLPTPPTVVCERADAALAAFQALGGDVVVKPLFGAMGNGIVRVEDPDLARRVFSALELERAAYFVQRCIAPPGRRDVRALVIGGEVAGAMERVSDSWRANVARGARPRALALDADVAALAVRAAAVMGTDVAGVDLLLCDDGPWVLEVNGIPGWQALQSVCATDLTATVVDHAESLLAPGGVSRS